MAFYIRLRETERRFEIKDLFEEHKNDKWELYYDAMDISGNFITTQWIC